MTSPAGRRQFLLAPGSRPGPSGWTRHEIAGGRAVHAHPDLPVHVARDDGRELVLLGYATDPHAPELDDAAILRRILSRVVTRADLVDACAVLGGRWVLVHHDTDGGFLLHDAAGLREVYHTASPVLAASQPGLLADVLGLARDERARLEFLEPQQARDPEFWWPGTRSPYAEIEALLPNHSLCLERGATTRTWPTRPRRSLDAQEAVSAAAGLLRGQLASMAARGPLAISITAGLDSRVVLAATRGLEPAPLSYTFRHHAMSPAHPDIQVPARLLGRLGRRHLVLDAPERMSAEFAALYRTQATLPHEFWGDVVEVLHHEFPADHVAVDGTVAEVARRFYLTGKPSSELSALDLARSSRMVETPFVLEAFERWLLGARPAAAEFGYDLLDLFYWEQRIGRWAASALTELDLVLETFTPFAQRELLEVLLGTDVRLGSRPRYRLFRDLAHELWPEVLREPINPVPLRPRLRNFARRSLRRLRRLGARAQSMSRNR